MSFTANPFFFTLQKHYELYLINKNFFFFYGEVDYGIKIHPTTIGSRVQRYDVFRYCAIPKSRYSYFIIPCSMKIFFSISTERSTCSLVCVAIRA